MRTMTIIQCALLQPFSVFNTIKWDQISNLTLIIHWNMSMGKRVKKPPNDIYMREIRATERCQC